MTLSRNNYVNSLMTLIDNEISNPSTATATPNPDTAYKQHLRDIFYQSQDFMLTLRNIRFEYVAINPTISHIGNKVVDKHEGQPMLMGLELEGAGYVTDQADHFTPFYQWILSQDRTPEQMFGIKTDGSLPRGYSFEVVSTKHTLSKLRESVAEFMKESKDAALHNPTELMCSYDARRAPSNETEMKQFGMHCHIGWKSIIGDTYLDEAYSNNLRMNRTAYILTALFRHLNTLCRTIGGRRKTGWDAGAKSNTIHAITDLAATRSAINQRSGHGTVEFRFGRMINSYEHTVGYVELCHALFKFADYIVTNNLEHYVIAKSQSQTTISHQLTSHYAGLNLMQWSKPREILQRRLINTLFFEFVMKSKRHYEVLPQVVDAYYHNEGQHFLRKRKADLSKLSEQLTTERNESELELI